MPPLASVVRTLLEQLRCGGARILEQTADATDVLAREGLQDGLGIAFEESYFVPALMPCLRCKRAGDQLLGQKKPARAADLVDIHQVLQKLHCRADREVAVSQHPLDIAQGENWQRPRRIEFLNGGCK